MFSGHLTDARADMFDVTTAIDVALHESGQAHDAVLPSGWTYLWTSDRPYHYWVSDPSGRRVEVDLRPLLLAHFEG